MEKKVIVSTIWNWSEKMGLGRKVVQITKRIMQNWKGNGENLVEEGCKLE